ncbi:ATP-binding protein [Conyzicola sp.]|uniref:ATP-binding protein n=1 Tax=Conyzicola sp. TaxID=1969404 RepID=UPI0039890D61
MTEPLALRCPPDDLDTVHDYIQRVWAASPELDAMDRLKFETALIELAANVIQHSNGGNGVVGTLSIAVDADRIRGSLADVSAPSEVDLADRDMPGEFAESGRGIAFIQRLVDAFHYERRQGENLWMIEKMRERERS